MRRGQLSIIVVLLALIGAAAACNLGDTALNTTPQPNAIAQLPTRTPPPIFPSITPLFGGSAAPRTAIPFGVAVPTLPPQVNAQQVGQPVITATPDRSGVLVQPGVVPGVVIVTATPVPGTITVPAGQIGSSLGALFTSLFTLTTGFLNNTWQFVGGQGGWIMQLICCVIPFLIAIGYVFRRGTRLFRW